MRLERGRSKPVSSSTIGQVELDDTELTMLLDGIDLRRVPRIQHWEPKKVVQGSTLQPVHNLLDMWPNPTT